MTKSIKEMLEEVKERFQDLLSEVDLANSPNDRYSPDIETGDAKRALTTLTEVLDRLDSECLEKKDFLKSGTIMFSRGYTDKLEAKIEELKSALQPFANFACGCEECHNCIAEKAIKGDTHV